MINASFVKRGFRWIWFDGNRAAALREFLRRENNARPQEHAFYQQIDRIMAADLPKNIPAEIYNTFSQDGSFKDKSEITGFLLADRLSIKVWRSVSATR
jgi:hypothetical protein